MKTNNDMKRKIYHFISTIFVLSLELCGELSYGKHESFLDFDALDDY